MAEKDNNAFGLGFLIGALAGVAIGFMYAPMAGKDTRARLREKAEGVREKAAQKIEQAREAAIEAGKKVRETLGE